ncbi:hypothetical protein QTI05_00115 [Variovorax sp. J22R193]|uniref:hypothetical protein n=1 Tax=Variovorax fucosicus TaxID=3053517 RepID=UPI0025784BAF|nr:hypothetical protein [Variovorax sp. J22R193]MDM0037404.1 hypothetical protein [Variovorax sp. J22R193]
MVLRLTGAKRLGAQLQTVKIELRRRVHHAIPEQGRVRCPASYNPMAAAGAAEEV